MLVLREYDFNTLEVEDRLTVTDRSKWRSARNSAYQYGQRTGKRFETYSDGFRLYIERVK
jgi:hypothetical protein